MAEMNANGSFSLSGRRVLYTGAAGGLGKDTTIEMLKSGANVLAVDNNADKIAELTSEIPNGLADNLIVVQCDLRDHVDLNAKLQALLIDGPIDVVINNAAIYPARPFEEFEQKEMRDVHAVNVEAALICVKAALPSMRKQGWGRIINVSSITLNGGWENLAPYVQSKGALIGLTRAWAREFGKWGITSNAIAPGAFPTDAEKIHPNPEEYADFVLENQSVKRRGSAQDIASVIKFLASNEAGFVTGQTINVDGGWSMK